MEFNLKNSSEIEELSRKNLTWKRGQGKCHLFHSVFPTHNQEYFWILWVKPFLERKIINLKIPISLQSHCPKFQAWFKTETSPGFVVRLSINDIKTSQMCSQEPLRRKIFWVFLILSLGTLPDLEKLVLSEKRGGRICCHKNIAQKKKPTQDFQRGFRDRIHLSSPPRNNFHPLPAEFLQPPLGFLHGIPPVGPSSLPQHGMGTLGMLEVTFVTFSSGGTFARGADVQLGLGRVFSNGFQSRSASPI